MQRAASVHHARGIGIKLLLYPNPLFLPFFLVGFRTKPIGMSVQPLDCWGIYNTYRKCRFLRFVYSLFRCLSTSRLFSRAVSA
jgi:hypothetical protein